MGGSDLYDYMLLVVGTTVYDSPSTIVIEAKGDIASMLRCLPLSKMLSIILHGVSSNSAHLQYLKASSLSSEYFLYLRDSWQS